MENLVIYTPRLLLRKIQQSDIDNIFKGLSHPDVIRYYGVSFDSLEATAAQMQWYDELEHNETGYWWAIFSNDGDEFIGAGGFNNLHKVHKKAKIGFWLLPNHWNKGYIQEAVSAICQIGFQKFNLHRIEAFVETENHLCKKSIEKLGFKPEGVMRDCEVKNGESISIAIYAMLSSD